MNKRILATALLALIVILSLQAQKTDLTQYVNTLQGTHSNFGLSHGNTFPATAMPYGVHMWTPQTGRNGDGFKYLYDADKIRGFGQAHQCSPWTGDYAVYSFYPSLDAEDGQNGDEKRGATFSHKNEVALPYYYSVVFDNGIKTEFSPTERCVHFRFSYPKIKDGDAWLFIDGYTAQHEISIDPTQRLVYGWVNNQRFVNHADNFRCYFVIQFDKPFKDYTIGKDGASLLFKSGTIVQAKAASSYISLDQASQTLERELGGDKTLEQAKKRGQQTWNALLSRIRVEGGTEEQMRTFYSCLFRANLTAHLIIIALTTARPMTAICSRIMVSGIPSALSSL